MANIFNMIERLCPDGVEYVDFKNVCYITKGVQFNKKNMNETGSFPVINGGIKPSGYIEQYNQEKETITVSQGGASAGYVNFIDSKFWAGAHCYIIKPKELVLNRYLYHFLKSKECKLQECQYGAGIPALAKSTVENLKIPAPPIEVQCEIVRILDIFTECIKLLEKELELRKKQYQYYRDKLLTFGDDIEYKTIKEVADIKAGKSINASQISSIQDKNHMIKCYGGNGLRGYVKEYNHSGEYPIIGRQGALCGNINYAVGDIYATEHAIIVNSKAELSQRFLYYLLITRNLKQYNSKG
ncbi:MAG: restriction endonuclease subunit S, partial [Ruminococcus sp.]|nr:restriction endonuclease subunit S [Ruminococcus sp.]